MQFAVIVAFDFLFLCLEWNKKMTVSSTHISVSDTVEMITFVNRLFTFWPCELSLCRNFLARLLHSN